MMRPQAQQRWHRRLAAAAIGVTLFLTSACRSGSSGAGASSDATSAPAPPGGRPGNGDRLLLALTAAGIRCENGIYRYGADELRNQGITAKSYYRCQTSSVRGVDLGKNGTERLSIGEFVDEASRKAFIEMNKRNVCDDRASNYPVVRHAEWTDAEGDRWLAMVITVNQKVDGMLARVSRAQQERVDRPTMDAVAKAVGGSVRVVCTNGVADDLNPG